MNRVTELRLEQSSVLGLLRVCDNESCISWNCREKADDVF
jgi:hypothetical protein